MPLALAQSPHLVVAALAVAGLLLTFHVMIWPALRRRRIRKRPFPAQWREQLPDRVPLYRRLPEPLQRRLEQHIMVFLEEKTLYGCDGLRVDQPMALTIAGHACLLVVARPYADLDALRTVLVYPGAYVVHESVSDGLIETEEADVRAGESWEEGRVVLSWDDCLEAIAHPDGPHNVMLHEFAHQLDHASGLTNGAPRLDDAESARRWQAVMNDAWERLGGALERDELDWLDPYGMSDPVEFFAVLSEAFFQQPRTLRDREPDVYDVMTRFYRVSPAEGFRLLD